MFLFLTNTKSFSRPRKGRSPEVDAFVLEYFERLQNEGLHVTREALM
jgi:hypothetical protein